jgi:hypothetical protein
MSLKSILTWSNGITVSMKDCGRWRSVSTTLTGFCSATDAPEENHHNGSRPVLIAS